MKQSKIDKLENKGIFVDPALYDTIEQAQKSIMRRYIFYNLFWHLIIFVGLLGLIIGGCYLCKDTVINFLNEQKQDMITELKQEISKEDITNALNEIQENITETEKKLETTDIEITGHDINGNPILSENS